MSTKQQISFYEGLMCKHGDSSYRSLGWQAHENQIARFHVFEHIFGIAGRGRDFSVLDIGCGFGDFFGHLKKRGYRFSYTGYDIAERVVQAAKKKHPGVKFEVKDILNDPRPERFDFVFSSGVFNIRFLEEEEHLELVKAMLLRMFEIAKVGVGANFLSSGAVYYISEEDLNSGIYYYFKPEEIIKYCRSFCSRFTLRHDYNPGDFTVFLLK